MYRETRNEEKILLRNLMNRYHLGYQDLHGWI